jgi:glycosyltransferase involved in cell wall biosynthesis
VKILISLHYPNPFPGAAWTRIEYFAEYFKNKGHQVSIIGVFSPKTLHKAGWVTRNEIKIVNITPVIMRNNILSLTFNVICSIFTSIVLLALLRPDITIISVPTGETAIGPYIAAKASKSKVVIDYRDEWEEVIIQGAKSKLYKTLIVKLRNLMTNYYSHSDFVVGVTEGLVASLASRGVKKIKFIPNGADLEIFKPYDKSYCRKKFGFDERDFVLVFSGKIGFYYRLDLVLYALQKFSRKRPNVKLLIVGEGPDLQLVRTLTDEGGLQDNVRYFGTKDNKLELAQLLCVGDIGLVPYDANRLWGSALPAKAFEYLASGLPIIATVYRDSILGKLLYENRVGLTSEPGSIDELVAIMERGYNDTVFLKEARERAVALVQGCFDRKKIAEEFLNLLRDVN